MQIERKWAMPNRWTFTIKPIADLLAQEMGSGMFIQGAWCDPFAGQHSPAQVRNDLNPKGNAQYHMDALEFLKTQSDDSFEGVLFDPPYSPRQVKECYESIGLPTVADHTKASFWSDCKDEITRIVKPQGKVISFGWTSMGMSRSRGFEMTRILLVPHGGAKNDTICTVEIKN